MISLSVDDVSWGLQVQTRCLSFVCFVQLPRTRCAADLASFICVAAVASVVYTHFADDNPGGSGSGFVGVSVTAADATYPTVAIEVL